MLTMVGILCAPERYVFAVSVTSLGPVAALIAGAWVVFICWVNVNIEPETRKYSQMSAWQFDFSSACWLSAP